MMTKTQKIGFTLTEIILALLVVSIGILSVIGIVTNALDSSKRMADDINAISFADMVFGYFSTCTNWSDIPPNGQNSIIIPGYNDDDITIEIGQNDDFTCQSLPKFGTTVIDNYTVNYTITTDSPDAHVKTMHIEVRPGFSQTGRPRSFYNEFYNWADK